MKKLLLCVLTWFLATNLVNSQTDQGTFYLGGSFQLSSSSEKTKANNTTVDGPKTFGFGINPNVGYFIGDNFMLGLSLGFDSETTKIKGETPGDIDEEKTTISAFNFGPFARYYIKPWDKSAFFIQAGIPLGFGKYKYDETDNGTTVSHETKVSSFGVEINPGLVFWATQAVCFEVVVGELSFSSVAYKNGSGDNEVKLTKSNFGLIFNPNYFGLAVGFHF